MNAISANGKLDPPGSMCEGVSATRLPSKKGMAAVSSWKRMALLELAMTSIRSRRCRVPSLALTQMPLSPGF